MPTHTRDDGPTVRAEASPGICHLAYVHAHSQRQTHRPNRDISRYPSTYACRNTHDPRITPEFPTTHPAFRRRQKPPHRRVVWYAKSTVPSDTNYL
ncbi:hypothetical protein THER5_1904 [Bifidobacterium thermacidophilum subsp. thermacidophilum]|uniref:Uncharacterized protein n=1 Tax=Bifidobacterium thermacidophilum subsp. thermacidophilum TaxID=79262 RepID=A0A087E2C3_9BIFI|nr:hypothetical protein THER5_1904 [Bifidobacterium thermacidophilum subsp. thermacidophilum]